MNPNSKERGNSTLTRRRTRSSYVLHWKFSYDVILFMFQSHQRHFAEF